MKPKPHEEMKIGKKKKAVGKKAKKKPVTTDGKTHAVDVKLA
jgi:hypothetical protein